MTNFITLTNGSQIPPLGFGTIQQFSKQIEDNVAFALNHGLKQLNKQLIFILHILLIFLLLILDFMEGNL